MIRLSSLAILAAGLIACSDTGRVDVSVATSPLAAEASDGTSGSLLVTITAVRVHVGDDDEDVVVDGDGGVVDDDQDGGGWTTVFEGAAALDLADADATALFLGTAEVPAGKITQLRLVLDGSPSYVVDGESHEVKCPSCTTSGLKIVTRGSLVLEDGDHLALDLLFDPATTLELTPSGYRMQPVVKLDKVRDLP